MKANRATIAISILLAAVSGTSLHAATIINFDNFPGMNFLGGAVPSGSQLSNQLVTSTGAVFSTDGGAAFVGVADLETGSPRQHAASVPNGIGGATSAGALSYGLGIRVTFFDPANVQVPGITDSVSIQGDLRGSNVGLVYLEAFDINGSLLGTASAFDADFGGSGVLTVAKPNIHSARLRSDSGSVAFDNLVFNAVTPIPEPSASLLAISGLMAMHARRRRKPSQ